MKYRIAHRDLFSGLRLAIGIVRAVMWSILLNFLVAQDLTQLV
jgi:hypothetical protein